MRKVLSVLLLLFIISTINAQNKTEFAKSKDGVSIAYITAGQGEKAIVFIHGWCCNKTYWENQITHFSKNYKVVAIDLAGHGESGRERKDYTIEAFAEDVKAVIEKLDLKNVILVGHSMGGYIIAQTASIIPERIKMIVGADTFQNVAETLTPQQAEDYLKQFKTDFKTFTYGFVKNMFPQSADQKLVEKIASDMSSAYAEMGISAMKNLLYADGLSLKGKILCPFKSINADLFPTDIETNKKHYQNFDVKFMKGYGHFVQIENPQLFNNLLEEFIKELK